MNKTHIFRPLAFMLILALALGLPGRAEGLFGWLFGEPDPTAVPAMAAATLPPVEALSGTPASAAPATPTPAPIPDATIEDDGVLRVALRSLEGPKRLDLTLAGVYALERDPGFRFDRDAQVTLTASEDSVFLSVSGLTIDMGPALTLTRHRAQEGLENGIYIAQSKKPTLYCGDLSVTAEGGGLRAVLTLPVEDYLYGVVGYEMSDSFPLEALKAQAVAARTYALQRKHRPGKRDYDVVDTTADQVFRGYDPDFRNVIQAVDETRGVVALYGDAFGECYFTASNGGQSALPGQIWSGAAGDDYMAMRDDPYDLENPYSLQNDVRFTADCEDCPTLKAMLEDALGEKLARAGWGAGEWKLDSISDIQPVNPRFEGSRMFDGLKFSLRAKLYAPVATDAPTDTPEPTATPTATATTGASATPTDIPAPTPTETPREWALSDETYDVVLDVYSQIKDGLHLGLNSGDWELIDVERYDDGWEQGFTLVMRRFGHGVGMSQRGAQWMAGHYGMSWRDILAFYYPGLTLSRISWPDDALDDLAALPAGVGVKRPRPTPTPTPLPLPAPRDGEKLAVVTASSLNVREKPTTSARALDQLPRGREVLAAATPDADGWVAVRTGELEGFVKAEFLEYRG